MQNLHQNGVYRLLLPSSTTFPLTVRHASLTSAINRGIRKATGHVERLGTRSPRSPDENEQKPKRSSQSFRLRPVRSQDVAHVSPGPRSRGPPFESSFSNRTHIRSKPAFDGGSPDEPRRAPRSRFEIERREREGTKTQIQLRRERKHRPVKEIISDEAPQGVPYTTAGSEFVYGTFAVTAALEARRRRTYKLYIWRGDRSAGDDYDASIATLARSKNIPVQFVAGDWEKLLMKMSGQRPHNGYILEASPVPKLPITALQPMENLNDELTVRVAPQSLEHQEMNKAFKATTSEATIPRAGDKTRYPLLLWLDRITDTGNIGAIVRTAYFFGVDAIIIPEHGTAPFNPVTIKASAGAAEHLPILTVKKEVDFVRASQAYGWRFFAAVAPDSASTKSKLGSGDTRSVESRALTRAPSVLMVGNEGEGLRSFMQQAADENISIHGVRSSSDGVDSLNVSVAAALLMARFLVEPLQVQPMKEDDGSIERSHLSENTMF